ncbi:MAG: hypothetical protein LBC87_07350 [Fibromonadaceae bacterium]|jgi:hypothetical protein|nr:hypothetical protein [Fibromonadaceae bacterium]
MRFLPIVFSTPMVRAILDGRKTQTRRIKYKCEIGDILWVRETFTKDLRTADSEWDYRADIPDYIANRKSPKIHWKSPYYMKGYLARLFLKVKNLRVEKLQDITETDFLAEGIIETKSEDILDYKEKTCGIYRYENFGSAYNTAKDAYKALWDNLNAERGYSWKNNPTIKVIEFERAIIENPFIPEMNYENLNKVELMKSKVKKAKKLLSKFYKAEAFAEYALQSFLRYLEQEFDLDLEATKFSYGSIGLVQNGQAGETKMSVSPEDLFSALESGEKVDADWIWRNT